MFFSTFIWNFYRGMKVFRILVIVLRASSSEDSTLEESLIWKNICENRLQSSPLHALHWELKWIVQQLNKCSLQIQMYPQTSKLRFILPCKRECQPIFLKKQGVYLLYAKFWLVGLLIKNIPDASHQYL